MPEATCLATMLYCLDVPCAQSIIIHLTCITNFYFNNFFFFSTSTTLHVEYSSSFSPPADRWPYFETHGREKEDSLDCDASTTGEACTIFWTLSLSLRPTCHLSIRPLPSISYCLNSALMCPYSIFSLVSLQHILFILKEFFRNENLTSKQFCLAEVILMGSPLPRAQLPWGMD